MNSMSVNRNGVGDKGVLFYYFDPFWLVVSLVAIVAGVEVIRLFQELKYPFKSEKLKPFQGEKSVPMDIYFPGMA